MTPITPESPCAAEFLASPNHGERRGGRRPDALVLHYTGMASSAEAQAWLCNPAAQVSCHYFVWEDGRIVQLVPEGRRAWHAGRSFWQGESDLNSASIGIEIANPGHDGGLPAFPEAQIAAVVALCRDIAARLAIPPQRVLAHSDIAPLRKRDPGEKFPWARLHREGIGHYVEPAPIGDDRRRRRSRSRPCKPCWHAMATKFPSAASIVRRRRPSCGPSSAISVPSGSTASPIDPPSRHCVR